MTGPPKRQDPNHMGRGFYQGAYEEYLRDSEELPGLLLRRFKPEAPMPLSSTAD